ncbi:MULTISPECIES: hypothetical protein [Xanthomonas]|uniref:hypothetical protein n=1 Tax=Xanthomonas TaxID=338 RepID=UPI001EDFBD75|nr:MULTISPECIES: hypothetical protein [Xanthomonas]
MWLKKANFSGLRSCGVGRMVASALVLGLLPFAVSAQTFPCSNTPGPGERMVGTAPGGPGLAPTPLCVRDGAASTGAAQPEYDPLKARATAALGMAQMLLSEKAKLASDPNYQRFSRGFWQHFDPSADAKPGDNCVAAYGNLQGIVTLAGPAGDYRRALIAFTGPGLPRPKKDGLIKVGLDGGDGKPTTVRAFHYLTPGTDLVTIAFAVPSAEAMLDGIDDKARYRLLIDNKQVFEIEWHDGHKARDELRRCIAAGSAS